MISYILFFVSFLIVSLAQGYVQYMYRKYSQVLNKKGLTGAEVARKILKKNGLDNVYVVETKGFLSDHYDPTRKVVRLSTSNYNDASILCLFRDYRTFINGRIKDSLSNI